MSTITNKILALPSNFSVFLILSCLGKTKAKDKFWDWSCDCGSRKEATVPWQYDNDCCTGVRRLVWIMFSMIFT